MISNLSRPVAALTDVNVHKNIKHTLQHRTKTRRSSFEIDNVENKYFTDYVHITTVYNGGVLAYK